YRAGRLDEALRQLDQADRLANEPNQAVQSSPAYTWFFLAMAHHRLGHGEEAKTWLDKAVTSTEKALGEQKQGTADVPWNRRLTLKLLRDEAEALLKSAPAPHSPEPAAKEKEKTEEKRKAESGKRE
ncbi:MAG: tetratricopeptide repeat protein, partial [Verrucomicrobiaceae bacterium]|nr:tetratricopeptide repeat protein [Verrucomicrobiaceae bacterium]